MLKVRNVAIECPVQHRVAPRWDLMIVLRCLMRPPFEPMNMASLADMTRKLVFLLTLASAKRNSEVWAFRAVVRFGQAVVSAKSVWLKTMDPSKPETFYAPVTIHYTHLWTRISLSGFSVPCQKGTELSIKGQHPNNPCFLNNEQTMNYSL